MNIVQENFLACMLFSVEMKCVYYFEIFCLTLVYSLTSRNTSWYVGNGKSFITLILLIQQNYATCTTTTTMMMMNMNVKKFIIHIHTMIKFALYSVCISHLQQKIRCSSVTFTRCYNLPVTLYNA